MDQRDAFFQAILEDPDDDATRLIFADWLEEQNDPLGEFIHVQFALRDMPTYDARRPQFEERERELLVLHQDEWTASIRRFRARFVPEFQRGFPYRVPLGIWHEAEQLVRAAPIQALSFDDYWEYRPQDSLEQALARPAFAQIRELDCGSRVRTDLQALVEAPNAENLRMLSLDPEQWRQQEAKLLAEASFAPQLERLVLGSSYIASNSHLCAEDGVIGRLFRRSTFRKLNSLELRTARFRIDEAEALASSPMLKNVESLTISKVGLEPEVMAAFVSGEGVERLRHLDLRSCRLFPRSIETFCNQSAWANRLTSFCLRSTNLKTAWLKQLGKCESFDSLAVLDLRGNTLQDDGATAFAKAKGFGSLQVLNLSYNRIGTDGARALAEGLPETLHTLDLSWNPIRADGARVLAAAEQLRSLRGLDLSYAELGDEGVKALANSPHLASLETLNLNSNGCTDDAVRAITHSDHLQKLTALNLGNNHLTKKGLRELLESPMFSRLAALNLTGTKIASKELREVRKDFRGVLGG